MKKTGLYIGTIILISCGVIFGLTIITKRTTPNGFKRIFKNINLQAIQVFELPAKDFFFSGNVSDVIYLKHHSEPDILFTINNSLVKLSGIKLNLPPSFNFKRKNIRLGTIGTNFFISDGADNQFAIGSLKDLSRIYYRTPNCNFDEPTLLSCNSVVVREVRLLRGRLQRYFLKFGLPDTSKLIRVAMKNQIDGFFSNDGLLQYDEKYLRFVYTYFYQGSFLCLDTNLTQMYVAKTIDTVKTADLKLKTITGGGKTETSTSYLRANPARFINKNFTIFKDLILVMSGLKADNESNSNFDSHQVIDVYRIADGKYLRSFYIPLYRSTKLREFRVSKDNLYCIFENNLVVYNGDLDFLKK